MKNLLNVIQDREWSDGQPFLHCYMSKQAGNLKHHIPSWNTKNSDLEKAGVKYHSFKLSCWPRHSQANGRRSVVVDQPAVMDEKTRFLVVDYRGGNGGLIEPANSLEWARLKKSVYPKSIFKLN